MPRSRRGRASPGRVPISRIRWPPGFKSADGFLDQPGDHLEPARAAVEGHPRLVIADSRLELLDLPRWGCREGWR